MSKAIFLDKDGTLVDNSGYPEIIPADLLLRDEILDGLHYLQEKGYLLIIISNQSWIAKKRLKREEVEQCFGSVCSQLAKEKIKITAYYYCPHQSLDKCSCKKPEIGLLERAKREYSLDFSASYIIGDMEDDILAGKRAGVKTILVKSGSAKKFSSSPSVRADYVIPNINHINEVM